MTNQTLYSLRTEGPEYRITKIVDGEVESSYTMTERECTCPAGHRTSCRHRQMIPDMLARGIVNTHWFWDFDLHRVVDFNGMLKSNFDAMQELAADRTTFTIPEGHVAVRDADGRATGEIQAVDEGPPSEVERTLDRAMGADADDQAKLERSLRPWRRL